MNKEVYVNIKISMPNGSDMSFSDEEIKEIQDYYEKEFSNFDYLVGEINVSFVDEKTKQIDQLKQQLEEIKDECNLYKKFADGGAIDLVIESVGRLREIEKLKQQLAEKDKEIEDCKRNELYEENMKILAVKNQTQLAIQELEKVKTLIQNAINFEKPNFVEVYDAINKQIKELKGE